MPYRHSGRLLIVKAVKCPAKSLSLVENTLPRKTCLKTFENQRLEQLAIIMHRHSPFRVVISDIQRIVQIAPVTTRFGTCHLSVLLVDKVNHHFHHHIFLFRTTFGYHQREGYERVVGNSFVTVLTVEDAVPLHEPKEEHGGNALVAIAEGMVLHHEVEKHRSLFLYRWIKVFASECLVYLPDAALEGIVLFVGKPLAAAELFFQCIDGLLCILVSSTEGFLAGGLADTKRLVVVAVKRIKGIYVVADDAEQALIFSGSHLLLQGNGTRHEIYHALQVIVVIKAFLVDGVAFDEVLFEDVVCPLAESSALYRLYSIADRDDHIKVIQGRFRYLLKTLAATIFLGMCKFCTCDISVQFSLFETILRNEDFVMQR